MNKDMDKGRTKDTGGPQAGLWLSVLKGGFFVLLLVSLGSFMGPTSPEAKELPAGTVINAANWQSMKDDTFEGKRIEDLVTPSFQVLLMQHKMNIRLAPSKPWPPNPRLINYTDQYSGQVRLDPTTPKIDGYVAGIPFPNIDRQDPNGALKIAYNVVYSAYLGDVLSWPSLVFVMVNQDGYQRAINYKFSLYQMIGRRSEGPGRHTEGDGAIRSYTTLIALEPFDVRGLGTFSVRYVDGRYDDVYAYLRAVRRWRRLSGSAWYDPVQGSDFLNDETSNGFNADPSWYSQFRILDKTVKLFPETDHGVFYDGNATDLRARYPYLALHEPPYWNLDYPGEQWRPWEVWEVEAIPPTGHPMSKRVLYIHTDPYFPTMMESDGYDLAGDLWHIYQIDWYRFQTDDGEPTMNASYARLVDIKNLSATLLPGTPGRHHNPQGTTLEDFNLAAITRLLQ